MAARSGPDRQTDRMVVGAAGACRSQPVTSRSARHTVRSSARPDVRTGSRRLGNRSSDPAVERNVRGASGELHQGTRRQRADWCACSHRDRWSARDGSRRARRTDPGAEGDCRSAVVWHANALCWRGATCGGGPSAADCRYGVQDNRDREPLVRPAGDGRDVCRPPGPVDALGVRQTSGVRP